MTIMALVIGILLGILFFGGLWYTVKKAINFKRPALWFLASFFTRTGVTLLGFYYISLGKWQHLLLCLVGFIVGRFMVLRMTKAKDVEKLELERKN